MSNNSKIEWTDATWNPIRGCTKVSPGRLYCWIRVQDLKAKRLDSCWVLVQCY